MKQILTLALVLFSMQAAFSADSLSFGDNTITWRVYESDGPVVAFAPQGTGIWYSTGTAVSFYDVKTTKVTPYTDLGSISSAGINAIVVDLTGAVWFGGTNGAACLKGGKFTVYNSKKEGLTAPINRMKLDRNGDIWFATEAGAVQYKSGSFVVHGLANLGSESIRDVALDGSGNAYFATDKGVAVFKNGAWKKYTTADGLSFNDVKAIAIDSKTGIIYAAAGELDVCSYNGKEWSGYMDIQKGITCIMVDTQSRIWFGGTSGILKFNGDEWISDPAKVGFPAAQVLDMYRDSRGDLYFAIERGVLHMKNPYPY